MKCRVNRNVKKEREEKKMKERRGQVMEGKGNRGRYECRVKRKIRLVKKMGKKKESKEREVC